MAQGALPGFRDFYPDELRARAFVTNAWRDVARRYALLEYDGPLLEPLDLYTRKSGGEIVTQLYSFTDKGEREVALRPEMTPTLARMVGARANALRKPVRWFSVPQLFRYERQQRGRLREHYQLNVDIVGEADVTADAELLACAVDMLRAFGLTDADFVARVSDRRILHAYLAALGVADDAMGAVYAVIDKLDRQTAAASTRALTDALVPPDSVAAILGVTSASLDDVAARLTSEEDVVLVESFRRYLRYLEALVPEAARYVRFDLGVVRGLAYYTGIVFELFDRKGEFRAICGGGRYDTLLGALGGTDLPALGFGMGDVVLTELLRSRGLLPATQPGLDFWVGADDPALLPVVMRVAQALRAAGASAEFPLRAQSLSRQLKGARAAGARTFALVDGSTPATGSLLLRPLDGGAERRASVQELTAQA